MSSTEKPPEASSEHETSHEAPVRPGAETAGSAETPTNQGDPAVNVGAEGARSSPEAPVSSTPEAPSASSPATVPQTPLAQKASRHPPPNEGVSQDSTDADEKASNKSESELSDKTMSNKPKTESLFSGPRAIVILLLAAFVAAVVVALVRDYYQHQLPTIEAAKPIGARIELVAGNVSIVEKDKTDKALSGHSLPTGAKVQALEGARAQIRSSDGALVILRDHTEVTLTERGFSLEDGELWLDAPALEASSVVIVAGAVTINAADSSIDIKKSKDEVTITVASGLAIVSAPGGHEEVAAGMQAKIIGNEPPKKAPSPINFVDFTEGMNDRHATFGKGAGRLFGQNPHAPPGTAPKSLGIAQETISATIRDGIAETEVDQTFSNPASQPLEGWYWFTLPTDAIITSFALETNGQLVEGEVIERGEAASHYASAVARSFDPALLEWVDGASYRARIYPIPANGTRRIVLRYMQLVPTIEGKARYVYPMRSVDSLKFDEFSLAVDVGANAKDIATSQDARVEDNHRKITMRRSGYAPRADFVVEWSTTKEAKPVRVYRREGGTQQADYLMVRFVPDVDFKALPTPKASVVVVVDTSAGGDKASQELRKQMTERTLHSLSDDDQFALVAVDVQARVLYPEKGLAHATEKDIAEAMNKLHVLGFEGASDLGSLFAPALDRLHGSEQPTIVYVGDGLATSGEMSADALRNRLTHSIGTSATRFFAVGAGTGASSSVLSELARAGSGRYFAVPDTDSITAQTLQLVASIKTPLLTDLTIDAGPGLDQPFATSSGTLSRGEEMILYARTHQPLPKTIKVRGHLGAQKFEREYDAKIDDSVITSFVPRLWASEYIHRLLGEGAEANRSKILELGRNYGLLTPFTSSIALENEAAYAREHIARNSSIVRLKLADLVRDSETHETSLPVTAIGGCDKASSSSERENAPAASMDDKSGGTGERHRGAEPIAANSAAPEPASPGGAGGYAQDRPSTPHASPTSTSDEPADQSAAKSGAAGATAPAPLKGPSRFAADPTRGTLGILGPGTSAACPPGVPNCDVDNGAGNDRKEKAPANPPAQKKLEETGRVAGGPAHEAGKDRTDKQEAMNAFAQVARRDAVQQNAPLPPAPPEALGVCSDVSTRPLIERTFVWARRLKTATTWQDLESQYRLAYRSCELPDFQDKTAFLDLVADKLQTEDAIQNLLLSMRFDRISQMHLARTILRRTFDPRLAAAVSRVMFSGINWLEVDRLLAEKEKLEDRLTILANARLIAPDDPDLELRMIRVLAKMGRHADALDKGRRLRDSGLMTPFLAQELGDVLFEEHQNDEALRTYSEIVEFDPNNPLARQWLGDILYRRGWYDAAYRQYQTLAELNPKDPFATLRLANAAAGAGRLLEALKKEHEVASSDGSPGPQDPRMFARMLSASRLAQLLASPPAGTTTLDLTRKLKELQLQTGDASVITFVVWKDLNARIQLVAEADVGEPTDAGSVGLYSVVASRDAFDKSKWQLRWRDDPKRDVDLTVVSLVWDGKEFHATTKAITLSMKDKSLSL